MISQQTQLLAQAIFELVRNGRADKLPVVTLHDTVSNEFFFQSTVAYCTGKQRAPGRYPNIRNVFQIERPLAEHLIKLIRMDIQQPLTHAEERKPARIVTVAADNGVGYLAGRMHIAFNSRTSFDPGAIIPSRLERYCSEILEQNPEPVNTPHLYELVNMYTAEKTGRNYRIGKRVWMKPCELKHAAARLCSMQAWCRIDDRTKERDSALLLHLAPTKQTRPRAPRASTQSYMYH